MTSGKKIRTRVQISKHHLISQIEVICNHNVRTFLTWFRLHLCLHVNQKHNLSLVGKYMTVYIV